MKSKLFFLTANENLATGLLRSQLIIPVEKHLSDYEVTFINIHRPFSNSYQHESIKVINLPILIPFRFINFTPLFFLNEAICLFYAIIVGFFIPQNSTLLCRSYVPGLIGFWLKYVQKVSLIFDPRSLYIQENEGINKIVHGSLKYKYWLWVEKRIVKIANRIVSVSNGQRDYYLNIGVELSRLTVIPCYAESLGLMPHLQREKQRIIRGYQSSDIVIGYQGSLNKGWNNVDLYKSVFNEVLKHRYKILIVSQDKEKLLQDDFFHNRDIQVVSLGEENGSSIGPDFIQLADYGLVLLEKTPDWFTRLTVKFVDYTSNGLPVIAGEYVGEAVRILTETDLSPSIIYRRSSDLHQLQRATSHERNKILNWGSLYFSNSNIKKIFL